MGRQKGNAHFGSFSANGRLLAIASVVRFPSGRTSPISRVLSDVSLSKSMEARMRARNDADATSRGIDQSLCEGLESLDWKTVRFWRIPKLR